MKINAELLKNFVRKASLNGSIYSINLDFRSDGLSSRVKDVTSVALTNTFLRSEAFEDYEALGELFIKDTRSFMSYLGTFNKVVELEQVEDYIIKVSDEKRSGYIILGSEKVAENVFKDDMPEIPYEGRVVVNKDELSQALADIKMLDINQIKISQKPSGLTLEVGKKGDSDFFVNKIETEEAEQEVDESPTVEVGELFSGFYRALDTGSFFEMKLGTDKPVQLHEETPDITFDCIIAPIVVNE